MRLGIGSDFGMEVGVRNGFWDRGWGQVSVPESGSGLGLGLGLGLDFGIWSGIIFKY